MSDAERLQMARDYLDTFSSPSGQRVLANLREACHDRLSYSPGDVYHTFINEGRREVYLSIVANLELAKDPERLTRVEGLGEA